MNKLKYIYVFIYNNKYVMVKVVGNLFIILAKYDRLWYYYV